MDASRNNDVRPAAGDPPARGDTADRPGARRAGGAEAGPPAPVELESIWVQAGGYRIHAWRGGEAVRSRPTVILLHGLLDAGRYLLPLGRVLARDYRVWIPELPGFGRSRRFGTPLDTEELADALDQWMEALSLEKTAFFATGHGCCVAVELAVEKPNRVQRLVLQGLSAQTEDSGLRKLGRWVSDSVREPSSTAMRLMLDSLQTRLRPSRRTLLRDAAMTPIDERLPDVCQATLVLRGARDPVVTEAWAEEIAGLLPRGRLAVIPGAAHVPTLTHAEDIGATIRAFLSEGGLFRRWRRGA